MAPARRCSVAAGGARGRGGRSLEPVSKGSTAGSEQAAEPHGGAGARGRQSRGGRRRGCGGTQLSEQGCSATGLQRAEQQHAAAGEQAPVRRCSVGAGARQARRQRWRVELGPWGCHFLNFYIAVSLGFKDSYGNIPYGFRRNRRALPLSRWKYL